MNRVTFLYLTIILLLLACRKKEQPSIDSKFVIGRLDIHKFQKSEFVDHIGAISFNFLHDTITNNIKVDEKQLGNELAKFDAIQVNLPTKLYLKAMFLADFTYSAFGYQFIGRELGLANDSAIFQDWKRYSLKEQFDFGNSNVISASCGVRTNFYKKLVKKYLSLKVRDTSIKGVHTYPIVTIADEEYLFDPSEPMVFCDDGAGKILDYKQLRASSAVSIYKSPRSFGTTHFLFSNNFLKTIEPFGDSLQEQVAHYLLSKQGLLLGKVRPCFPPNFQKEWDLYSTKSKNNPIAIPLENRNIGMLLNVANWEETYFGEDCKNAKR